MTKTDLALELTINTNISEIKTDSDEWKATDVVSLPEADIKEILENDQKPVFAEFIGIYAGQGNDSYTEDAVKSAVSLMPGTLMYKGHQQPGTEDWAYREPVGRVLAAKLTHIDIDGSRVLAAKGKAYISEAEQKLRADIKRKLAGPVSVLGEARAVRDVKTGKRTVLKINRLKSIDFCNPGTSGLAHAGVTAIIKEIASKQETMAKLTKEQLLAEYSDEIKALMGEQVETQIREIANRERTLAAAKQEFENKKAEFTTQISEITKSRDAEKARADKAEAELTQERSARLSAQLQVYANDKIAEMKQQSNVTDEVAALTIATLKPSLIDNDLDKSKKAFDESAKAELEKAVKIMEMSGNKVEGTTTVPKTGNRKIGGSAKDKLKSILDPKLAKMLGE